MPPANVKLAQDTDLAIAQIMQRRSAVEKLRASAAIARLISMSKPDYYYRGRKRVTDRTLDEAVEILDAAIAAQPDGPMRDLGYISAVSIREQYDKLAAARAAIAACDAEVAPLDAIYHENGRWPRFFLVTSSAGHIHSSMSCSTCRFTTTYGWLPNLSGLDEKAAVKAHGPALCSVCFPSAPVAMVGGRLTVREAEDAAKAALEGRPAPKRAARPEKVYCAGSGQRAENWQPQYASPRGTCPVCKQGISPSSLGNVRKHAPV